MGGNIPSFHKHKNEQNHRPLGTVRPARVHIQLFRKRMGSVFGPDSTAFVGCVHIRGGWLGQVGGAVGCLTVNLLDAQFLSQI